VSASGRLGDRPEAGRPRPPTYPQDASQPPQAGPGRPPAGPGRREYLWETLTALWPPPARISRRAPRPFAMNVTATGKDSPGRHSHGKRRRRGGVAPGGAAAPGAVEFAVFPRERNPVLLIPLRPRRVAAAALRGYKASGDTRDRLRFGLAAAAAAAGLGRLAPDRISIEPGTPAASTGGTAADIAGYLRSVLGGDVSVALHVGAPRANRKPVLQVISSGGEVAGFVKVSLNPLTADLVRAEAATLELLAGAPLTHLRPPRLLHHGRWRGHEVLVQEAFRPGRPASGLPGLTAAMTELARLRGVSRRPATGSPYWQDLRARLAALRPGPAGPLLPALDALAATADGLTLAFGAWHGDWTPWNMTMSGGQAMVWDWERFATGVPVGYDAVHYRLQGDIVRGGADPTAAAEAALAGAAGILAPFGTEPDAAGLVAALYLTELAARYVSESQAEAGARLGKIDTWLLPALTRHMQRSGGLARR
jgi:hypothetical protein